MAIRIRIINNVTVALCAYETDAAEGDVYLDDAQHYALAAKFRADWYGKKNNIRYPREWALMDTQKIRDATKRKDL